MIAKDYDAPSVADIMQCITKSLSYSSSFDDDIGAHSPGSVGNLVLGVFAAGINNFQQPGPRPSEAELDSRLCLSLDWLLPVWPAVLPAVRGAENTILLIVYPQDTLYLLDKGSFFGMVQAPKSTTWSGSAKVRISLEALARDPDPCHMT